MSDTQITLTLPQDLIDRARAAGMDIDSITPDVIALLEERLKRREAWGRLLEMAEQMQQVPDELKPSLEEIEEEIRAYWAERHATSNVDKP